MKRVALICEGRGDVAALPSLIARAAAAIGAAVTVCDPPIRAGEAKKLRRAGELERFVDLALRREGAEEVLVVLDLDDDCPATFHAEFLSRVRELAERHGKKVHICFCVREYEAWFLTRIDDLKAAFPEFGWKEEAKFPKPDEIRGAKEALSGACSRGYKQTRDQLAFSKKLEIKLLASQSRSFKKLLKSILNISYEELNAKLAA